MKDSDNRIQFIADYISAYENKIKLLNSNGLFDAAKLFELFAIEVGSLYFGQRISNLNVDTFTYPYVDLISADKQTYIQVSTVKDVPAKIKTTLNKIKNSKRAEFSTLTNVKFIMLNNDSIDDVRDYVGQSQIGNISFTKANDLITTGDIIQKAKDDLDFQIALYNLLEKESQSIKDNSDRLKEAIENSNSIGLRDIDCKINNEYEIDRSEFVSKIKAENHKNISIQGEAGSGKSVLCKMLVEGEENIVYARAERFQEETNINNIWGFNVRQTLQYLDGKPFVFFIDSLEFIADIPTKRDLLHELYECTNEYPMVKIITSCRTSDKNAFLKIDSLYSVRSYEVSELAKKEQLKIADKYPIVKRMLDINSYAQLLKSPFYINLIVSKITDMDNISDENELREYIWLHVICLNDSAVMKLVELIVFTRAKNFLLGVASTDYDTKTIEKLISESVLVKNDKDKTVRLKYDIFEDICFEQYLDNKFRNCKGKYDTFFMEIEPLGRCIYRRYQIWISNKLLAKNNREKFLYELIFSDKMPLKWRKQTEIGLVKSRYCEQFFKEYAQSIIKNGILNDFITTTNLYAFEIVNDNLSELYPLIRLRPCGEGRRSLIHLIVENKLYEDDNIPQYDLEKICTDYSKAHTKDNQTAEKACLILTFFVERHLANSESKDYYKLDDILNTLLTPIYQMSKYSRDWIKAFWAKLTCYYQKGNRGEERLADDIIEDTLKFNHTELAIHMPIELCELAEMFWTYSPEKNHSHNYYGLYERDRRDEITYQYGMNENAEQYEHGSTRSTAIDSNFFFFLFRKNFWIGLDWTINFVNKAVMSFSKTHNGLPSCEINFIEDGTKKSYLGCQDMWLATTQTHKMPMVISDLIYCLKEKLRYVIKNDLVENNETEIFAKNVANYIYKKSNNIALLTIIADIGMEFRDKLPGFTLDLATNIDLILCDLTRYALLIPNPVREMYRKQIFMSMGMPDVIPDRYSKKDVPPYTLLAYVRDSQMYGRCEIKYKCHAILDYLYSIIPNDEENATSYLQIQKMDMRNIHVEQVDDSTIAITPTITGEAKKVTEEMEQQRQPETAIGLLFHSCQEKLTKNIFKLNDCIEAIEQLLEMKDECSVPSVYDKTLIDLINFAINDNNLVCDTRTKYCQIWIDGVKSYFSNHGFIFEHSHILTLFAQIDSDVCEEIKRQIKQLILDLIMFEGNHGVVAELARYARMYLASNNQLAKAVFNTIVKLSEDEMNHQKFNAEYIQKHGQKEDFEFLPNMQPKLWGVDNIISSHNAKSYQSKKNEIIESYLFNNKKLDLSSFDMSNYDILTICYAVNSGLSLNDTVFYGVVKKLIVTMIDIWKSNDRTHNSHKILDTYILFEVMHFLQAEFIKSENHTALVLDILFTDIDFTKFTSETIEFYLDVFGALLSEYFYSHNDKSRRSKCECIIRLLENKVSVLEEEKVKLELYKSLILSVTTYGGAGDWSECPSGYTYQDKQFLNDLFRKYGGYHLKEIVRTIRKLHINKLLPEILLSLRDALENASEAAVAKSKHRLFSEALRELKAPIIVIMTKAFLDFSYPIKQDDDLTKAFEEILEILVELRCEEAATILDEFRIH